MKTNFLCVLSIAALLFSCSNDESQTSNSTNSNNITKSMTSKEDNLDAPFKSFSYVAVDNDTYDFFFEVPSNYATSVSIENGKYIVDLTSNDPKDSDTYTNHKLRLDAIGNSISLSFRVNGSFPKKPHIEIPF